MNQNIDKGRFQFIPRTLVFIKNNDKYLLIIKNKAGFGHKKLNGIGGHIEQGENPFQSARREIFEETGLKITDLVLTGLLFIDTMTNPGIQVFIFKCKTSSFLTNNSEEGDLFWLSKEEIKKRNDAVEDLLDLIELCENYKYPEIPKLIQYNIDNFGKLRIDYIN